MFQTYVLYDIGGKSFSQVMVLTYIYSFDCAYDSINNEILSTA